MKIIKLPTILKIDDTEDAKNFIDVRIMKKIKIDDIEDAGNFIDVCMNELYHYGLSKKGSFGYEANMASAKAALDLIKMGENDIDKLSDAIHEGWSHIAKTFDDPVYAQKPEKKESRLKLANTPFSELSEEEKDKDRVIAKIMIDYFQLSQNEYAINKKENHG